MNANKRRLDVWLIYKCNVCQNTLNVEVHERSAVTKLGGEKLYNYSNNDSHSVDQVAFDLPLLWNLGFETEDPEYSVEIQELSGDCRERTITVHPAHPVRVRFDKVIADGLGIGRSEVGILFATGKWRFRSGDTTLNRKRLIDSPVIIDIVD